MGIFSKSKKKDDLVLVFDIMSSSVGAALFYKQKSGIPKIIFSVREPVVLEEKVTIDRLFALTLNSLDMVASQVSKAGLGAPSEIFCVLSSPWYISQTRIASVQKDTPFICTSKLAETLTQQEVHLLQEEYIKNYEHVGTALRIIELKNIKVMLNGYETTKPTGKKTKELEMTIFVSISAEEVCKRIEESLSKHFSVRRIKFSSFPMASFAVVRDMNTHQENFLLIHIGGEITDISMVKNNVLRESTSFPLGSNFMIREVASATLATLAEAKSLISLFKDGHAEAGVAEKLTPIMTKLKKEWLSQFQKSLEHLSNDISIPAVIYITVEKDLMSFFREVIETEEFNQYTLTESKFQIAFLDVQALHDMALYEKDVLFDSFLAIDAIYITRSLI